MTSIRPVPKYPKISTDNNLHYYGVSSGLKDSDKRISGLYSGSWLARTGMIKDSFAFYFPRPDKCSGPIRGEK